MLTSPPGTAHCLTCARLALQRAAALRKGPEDVDKVEREREQHVRAAHR
ncbi:MULTISPECIES: hypothetical protein [Streptomyces]